MQNSIALNDFRENLNRWLVGLSGINYQFVLIRVNEEWKCVKAHFQLTSWTYPEPVHSEISTPDLRVGSIQKNVSPEEIETFISDLLIGNVPIYSEIVSLLRNESNDKPSYSGPSPFFEPSDFIPKLEIVGGQSHYLPFIANLKKINDDLRCLDTPFDGLADVLSFFGFENSNQLPQVQSIIISIHPPVTLDPSKCSLEDGELNVSLAKNTKFPVEDINLGIRIFPNPRLDRRCQIGDQVDWKTQEQIDIGQCKLTLENASSVELLLSAGKTTVSRYFVFDQTRSLNPRLQTYIQYDKDLRVLKDSLFSTSKESRYLESGIATLAYLLGVTPLNPPLLLTDAPDLILDISQQYFVIIECTTKISDLRAKAGKLVDRKFPILTNSFGQGINNENLLLVLVVNLPKAQIIDEAAFLLKNEVLLITKEDIELALNNLQFPSQPSEIFKQAKEKLQTNLSLAQYRTTS
ncbi:hypothetical protein [Undibacterium baiyunense]|uniref:Uncharacterized protein n=1 Tax=Undibacterium baiyunense TaxID=2828731 RepID=A0A941DCD8_9BURK|nr:hypothetical protein [Undibacterium baiyunense]MBR7746109.1 hypothetical protein [Undibacterium baiyunense]